MYRDIYMDHAATTKMRKEVVEAMCPFYRKNFENASTGYEQGKKNREVIQQARSQIASCIGAKPQEIYFTSGGSEADNWAIKGFASANKAEKNHVITTQIEHHAILNSCKYLEKLGYALTYLPVDEKGRVDVRQLKKEIRPQTALISIMFGNNEIGTIEPIEEIGLLAKERGVVFHTDAVQAVGQVKIDVENMMISSLSASAHKFYGPKGVGFLYVKGTREIPSFIHGGGQEYGKRAGTENVAGIVGMAKALELACSSMEEHDRQVSSLRDYFIFLARKNIPDIRINGDEWQRLPGNVSISFRGIEAGTLLLVLEEYHILAAAGSACSTGNTMLSHVLQAISLPEEYGIGTLRFSLGYTNTREEVEYVITVLQKVVAQMRKE